MSNIAILESQIKAARIRGALFHPTNPADAYFCDCGVFARLIKGETRACWSCGNKDLNWQYVPRFGGGAETVIHEPEPTSRQNVVPDVTLWYVSDTNPCEEMI